MEKRDLGYSEQPAPAQFDQPPPYNPSQSVPVAGISNPAFVQQVPPQTVVVVQQPQQDPNHIPELFETDSKDWFLFCGLGWFVGWCTACYLGGKYKLKCNLLLWILPGFLLVAGAVVYGVMIGLGVSNATHQNCFWEYDRYRQKEVWHCEDNWGGYVMSIIIGASVFGGLAFISSMILLGALICLRRKFVEKSKIRENCCMSCLIVNVCQPCAFGQMGSYASLQHL